MENVQYCLFTIYFIKIYKVAESDCHIWMQPVDYSSIKWQQKRYINGKTFTFKNVAYSLQNGFILQTLHLAKWIEWAPKIWDHLKNLWFKIKLEFVTLTVFNTWYKKYIHWKIKKRIMEVSKPDYSTRAKSYLFPYCWHIVVTAAYQIHFQFMLSF